MKALFCTSGIVTALALTACATPVAVVEPAPKTTVVVPVTTTPAPTVTPATIIPSNDVLPNIVCANQTQSVTMTLGTLTQQGTLQGYNYCEYQIQLKAGQRLAVNFTSPSPQAQAIVFDNATIDLGTEYVAPTNQVLPVRVLLTRNEARTGKAYPFTVQFQVR